MGALFSKDEEVGRANKINDINETLRKARQQRQVMEDIAEATRKATAMEDTGEEKEDEVVMQLLQEGGFIDSPVQPKAKAQSGGFFMVCA